MNTRKHMLVVLTATALAVIAFTFSGCAGKEPAQTHSGTVQYTCPMHPDVVQDKPGKCPKCGMDLVEKK